MPIVHPDLDNKTSVLVNSQVPEFVSSDHPKFVEFLEKYYEWMEQIGNPLEVIGNLPAYNDIDQTVESFIQYFKKQYFPGISDDTLVNKEFIQKNIREFFRARGSEESFKILFRMLFDDEVTLTFPGLDILKASDGKWGSDTVIKTLFDTAGQNRLFDLTGRLITGQTSGATAIVEQAIRFQLGVDTVVQYVLNEDSRRGIFTTGETISGFDQDGNEFTSLLEGQLIDTTVDVAGSGYSVGDNLPVTGGGAGAVGMVVNVLEITSGSVDGVSIDTPGTGYSVGDKLVINNTDKFAALGRTASILVKSVGGSGEITAIEIENGGNNYIDVPLIDATTTGNGDAVLTATSVTIGGIVKLVIANSGFKVSAVPTIDASGEGDGNATITGIIGPVVIEEGRFLNSDGKLSEDKVLQDSFFFQDFSYVIRAEQSINFWRDQIKKELHPAGMQLFGAVSIESLLDASIADGTSINGLELPPFTVDLDFPVGSQASLDLTMSLFPMMCLVLSNLNTLTNRNLGMGLDYAHTVRNMFKTEGGLVDFDHAGGVTLIRVVTEGDSYTVAPTVVIDDTGTGGSGATATATIAGGIVTGVTVDTPGTNYNFPPTITFSGGTVGTVATGVGVMKTDSGGTNIGVYDNINVGELADHIENSTSRKRTRYTVNALVEMQR